MAIRCFLGHGASGTAASMAPFVAGLRARGVDAKAIDLPKRKAEDAVPADGAPRGTNAGEQGQHDGSLLGSLGEARLDFRSGQGSRVASWIDGRNRTTAYVSMAGTAFSPVTREGSGIGQSDSTGTHNSTNHMSESVYLLQFVAVKV
jgi:hypothetical protein